MVTVRGVVTSCCFGCHCFCISTNCGPADRTENSKKVDMYDFPVHDYTQEQNSSPYFSSTIRQCKWPSLSKKIVVIQKFCYHGTVTSHSSSLYSLTV